MAAATTSEDALTDNCVGRDKDSLTCVNSDGDDVVDVEEAGTSFDGVTGSGDSDHIVCDPCKALALVHAGRSGNVRERLIDRLTVVSKGERIQLLVSGLPSPASIMRSWERRLLTLLHKHLELEHLMWNLSTLGGAYSAMADYDLRFATRATSISAMQIRLAEELGDPITLARCRLYIALAAAQQGFFTEAYGIVKSQLRAARHFRSALLEACCRGVRAKIEAIRILGTDALPVVRLNDDRNDAVLEQ